MTDSPGSTPPESAAPIEPIEAEQETGKKARGRHQLTQEDRQRGADATKRRAAVRRGVASQPTDPHVLHVTVPINLSTVVAGLQTKADKGDPAATRALLEVLARYPVESASSAQAVLDKPFAAMSRDELSFARSYLTRRILRAKRKADAMSSTPALEPNTTGQKAPDQARSEESSIQQPSSGGPPGRPGTPAA